MSCKKTNVQSTKILWFSWKYRLNAASMFAKKYSEINRNNNDLINDKLLMFTSKYTAHFKMNLFTFIHSLVI